MSAAANIVLLDALATPVSHTFIPLGADANGVWWFEDQSAAAPIGYNRISIDLSRPKNPSPGESSANRIIRVKVGVHTPKMEVTSNNTVSGIAPAPTLSYIPRCNVEFMLPERSSLQDRKDIRKYVQNLIAALHVSDAVENLQGIW